MSFDQPACLIDRIDAEADDLDAALVELRLDPRHVAELGRTHWREVLGVREHHAPGIAEPLVKADRAFGGLGFKVRRISANRQRSSAHRSSPAKFH